MTSIKITTALLTATVVLAAHHSAAMFDDTKVVELSGTVKALQWTNPHVWLQVMVEDKGTATSTTVAVSSAVAILMDVIRAPRLLGDAVERLAVGTERQSLARRAHGIAVVLAA